jgi:hypothetical protein
MRGLAWRREAAPWGRERAPWRREGARVEEPSRGLAAGRAVTGASFAAFAFLARLVMTVAALIALLIVLAIVLGDVDANAHNSIVKGIHEAANFFAGAFTGLITFHRHPKLSLSVNWGIAAIVYLLVGSLISRVIARPGVGRRAY